MTIIEAINRLDTLKFNTYTQDDKVAWLSRADAMVKKLIIDTHEGAEDVNFTGYDDEVYLRWMEAQIDYHNGEYDKYNNAIIMYNTAFEAYQNYYNRTHMPVQKGRRFLF